MKDKVLPSILSALVLSACVKVFAGGNIYPVNNQFAALGLHAVLMVFFYLATFKFLARMDQTLIITESYFFACTHTGQAKIPFEDMAEFSITRHIDHRPQYTRGLIEIKLKNGKDYFTAIFLSQIQIDQIAHIVNVQLKVAPIAIDHEKNFEA